MSFFRQAFAGVFAAAAVSLIVIGAIVLGMTEGMVLPDDSQPTEAQPTSDLQTMFPGIVFSTAAPRRTSGPRLVAATTQPATSSCAAKSTVPNWQAYKFLTSDSLDELAAARGITANDILEKNCLGPNSIGILPGRTLLLPPLPTSTPTATATPQPTDTRSPSRTAAAYLTITPCTTVRPSGWVLYVIQSGDTLFHIAGGNTLTQNTIQRVNCIFNPNQILPGDRIWVPALPPSDTATRTSLPSTATSRPPANTATFTPKPPTSTFTFTPVPPTATFTSTPVSATSTFTFTPVPPTATFTFTPKPPTATFTPVPPTATRTLTSTIGTNLATKTSIPTATFTFTPTTGGTH